MNPRIVILTTYYRPVVGGVESNAERLASYLQAGGFDVTVLTKRVTADLPANETIDHVRVMRIGPLGHRSASGKWRLVIPALRWLISHRGDYDAVCCIDFRGVGFAPLIARVFTGKRVLFQAQTPGVFRWPVRSAYRRADIMACIGRELERQALALGVRKERVWFLPNPIDLVRFRPAAEGERTETRNQLNVPAETCLCVFLGRLSREKGVMDLMEAWRLLQPHLSNGKGNAVLVVAGPDMEGHPWNAGPSAREFVQANGLSSSVTFIGPVKDPAPLLRGADLFIQPSHFEAQGLSAVEALASGVPVVASSVGGLLDFIKEGVNGLLCSPQNPAALEIALRTAITDEVLRNRLAAASRASIARDYDEREVYGRFAELLRGLVSAHT